MSRTAIENCKLYVYDAFDTGSLSVISTTDTVISAAITAPFTLPERTAAVDYFMTPLNKDGLGETERNEALSTAVIHYFSLTETWNLSKDKIGEDVLHGIVLRYAKGGLKIGKLRPLAFIGDNECLSSEDVYLAAVGVIKHDRANNPEMVPSTEIVPIS